MDESFAREKEIEGLIAEVERLREEHKEEIFEETSFTFAELLSRCNNGFISISDEVFEVWKSSSDRKAVEEMFRLFTDMDFLEYLEDEKNSW